MSNTDGQLALQAVEDAFQLEIARQELEHLWMGNYPRFHIFWVIYSKGSCEQQLVTAVLQEFASSFLKFYMEEFRFCFKCFLFRITIFVYSYPLSFVYRLSGVSQRSTYHGHVFMSPHARNTETRATLKEDGKTKCGTEFLNPPNYVDLEVFSLDPNSQI